MIHGYLAFKFPKKSQF